MTSSAAPLYELHDRAREREIDGYRRMSRDELLEVLEAVPEEPAGPTVVEAELRGPLGLLTLRGADNALTLEALERLADEAERLALDPAVRLVAITGAGDRVFSAGADLEAIRGLDGAEVTVRGTLACERIAALSVPTLALINGHVVGGAIDLVLACDWRIAVRGAKLRFIHNELGYSPPWGAAHRLAALVPAGVALRLFATCDLLGVDEARTLGLVDELVVRDRLRASGEALAARVQRSRPDAVAATKHLLRARPALVEHERAFAALWDAKLQA
ncbi:MAG: enoyl-CoA hydratase/isomerase family protein [Gaiellales bacterium]